MGRVAQVLTKCSKKTCVVALYSTFVNHSKACVNPTNSDALKDCIVG
jgi:hypothetical protein